MSVTDPTADVAQPEGQGDAGTTDAPYAEYLSRIPEEVRGDVEPIFKEWDANTTRRFQEHSEYRKTWEPYEQAGVTQYSPQDIQAAFQLLQDPQAARSWLDQQYGPTAAPEAPQQPEDPYGYQDPAQQLEQLLASKLDPLQKQLEQLGQWRESFEQQAHEAQVSEQINQAIADLKAKEAESLPAELRDQFDSLIERFGMQYAEPGADPKQVVARAWADFQTVLHAAEKNAFQSSANAPKPAEGGGVADVTPPQFKTIMDGGLQEAAKEFLRNSNRM